MAFALKTQRIDGPRFEDDVQLARRAAEGDEAAERALVYRVAGRVKKSCRYLSGQNDAEDMAQLVLMQVVLSAGRFRGDCPLEYWVDRVTVQTVAKHLEKRSRRRRIREAIWDPGPEIVSVDRQAALKQVQDALTDQFANLSEKQRGAVVLHYLFGYEIPEIADLLNVRINAVRSRLRKGLAQLRRHILKDPRLRDWVREGRK